MTTLLVLISLLVVFGAGLFVSEATLGVYIAIVGCYFAILARIAQAGEQSRALLNKLDETRVTTSLDIKRQQE